MSFSPGRNSPPFPQPHHQPSITSKDSSHGSLPSAITTTLHVATAPLLSKNAISDFPSPSPRRTDTYGPPSPIVPSSNTMANAAQMRSQPHHSDIQSADTHERMWAEMQQKLAEVELSTAYVFGTSHAKSLEELRVAQRGLAQAWMRSEENALDGEHAEFGKMAFAAGGGITPGPCGKGSGSEQSIGVEGTQVCGALGQGAGRVDQETENDILLARKRRQANDAHFRRVALSVTDVIHKLESVAKAMAGVERESRGIWDSSNESDNSSLR